MITGVTFFWFVVQAAQVVAVTRNMRTPPNYVLYNKGESVSLKSELSWNQELGWRYTEDDMALSATLFYISFFFNDTATTEIYTLSLHDALPI